MAVTDDAISAIAEPRRRQILRLIRQGELSAGEIASHFEVSQPAISQHLKVLKQTELVMERRQGTKRFYRANIETLSALRDYLGWMWDRGLEGLKRAVEEEEQTK